MLIDIEIDVLCTLKAHDGVTRTALCGTATGNINVFEIEQSNLAKAKMAGFSEVTDLAHFRAVKCE